MIRTASDSLESLFDSCFHYLASSGKRGEFKKKDVYPNRAALECKTLNFKLYVFRQVIALQMSSLQAGD